MKMIKSKFKIKEKKSQAEDTEILLRVLKVENGYIYLKNMESDYKG